MQIKSSKRAAHQIQFSFGLLSCVSSRITSHVAVYCLLILNNGNCTSVRCWETAHHSPTAICDYCAVKSAWGSSICWLSPSVQDNYVTIIAQRWLWIPVHWGGWVGSIWMCELPKLIAWVFLNFQPGWLHFACQVCAWLFFPFASLYGLLWPLHFNQLRRDNLFFSTGAVYIFNLHSQSVRKSNVS